MATKILSIIAALQHLQITPAGWQPVPAPPLSDLPINPAAGDLPMRIISPTINLIQAKSAKPMTFAGGRTYEWEIEDLFLFKPVTSSAGYTECAYPILEFVQAYSAVMDVNVKLMQGVTIEDAPPMLGIFEYPKGANKAYGGVLHKLTIKEIVE